MDNQQCIFCGIANGGVPSKKVYEDEKVTVVLDIYPANPAHLLVLTKQHYAIFNQLSKDDVEHLGVICKRISELMFKVLKPEGINFFIANGAVAGQKAPHMILHVIPRFSGDGLKFELPYVTVDEKELDSYHDSLKATLKNYFPNVDFNSSQPPVEEQKEHASSDEEEKTEKIEPAQKEIEAEKKEEMQEQQTKKEREPEKKGDDINLDKITEMFS